MIRLKHFGYYVTGRYDYSAIDGPGETLITGIKTKKLANEILSAVSMAIHKTLRANKIATLLKDLETIKEYLDWLEITAKSDRHLAAIKRINAWIAEHQDIDETNAVYLSAEREQWDDEAEARRTANV